jgi:hypothetical protein
MQQLSLGRKKANQQCLSVCSWMNGDLLPSIRRIGQHERLPSMTKAIERLLDPSEDLNGIWEEVVGELQADGFRWRINSREVRNGVGDVVDAVDIGGGCLLEGSRGKRSEDGVGGGRRER